MDTRTVQYETLTAQSQAQTSDQLQLLMASGAAIGFILLVVIIMLIYAVIKTSNEATKIRKLLESQLVEVKNDTIQKDSSTPRE